MSENEALFLGLVKEGVFEVREDGTVWRLVDMRSPHKLCEPRAATYENVGYLYIIFWAKNKRRTIRAHRVVYIYFFGDIPDGHVINHKNGIKTDNRPENLEVVTQLENILHARDVLRTTPLGEEKTLAKVTTTDVVEMRRTYSAGGVSMRELAEKYGINTTTVFSIVHRKSWKHVS